MSILKGLKLNSANARGFLFFLLLTSILATLIKLSKSYEISRSLSVEVTDLPLDRTVSSIIPKTLEVEAEITGFSLLRNTFNGQKLQIPFDELEAVSWGSFLFNPLDHKNTIQRSLASKALIVSIKPKKVAVRIDSLASKRVVVIPQTSISYATGYSAANNVISEPDSITIVGPSEILKAIELVNTRKLDKNEVNESIKMLIGIDKDSISSKVKLSQDEVIIEQRVSRFTEGAVTVPITILNDKDNKLKILPKTVQIVYKVALDDFETIRASDFLVTCDYNKVSTSRDYLPLKIERQPTTISSPRLSTKQAKYIIINE